MLGRRDRAERRQRLQALAEENARLTAALSAQRGEFSRLARAVWRLEDDERRRLAQELHDALGQELTVLGLAVRRLPDGEARDEAAAQADRCLAAVRDLSRLLRPPVLDDLGLDAALEWLARRTREGAGLPVRTTLEAGPLHDPRAESLIFRIAQEAVTNAVRHAGANRVDLTLCRTGDRVELTVRDDGGGFDPEAHEAGVGISGMRDRVALLGGELTIDAAPGRGACVRASLRTSRGADG